jgi:hypothetical protein
LIDCALAAAGRQDSRGLRKIKQPIGLVTTVSHRCQPVFYFPRAFPISVSRGGELRAQYYRR